MSAFHPRSLIVAVGLCGLGLACGGQATPPATDGSTGPAEPLTTTTSATTESSGAPSSGSSSSSGDGTSEPGTSGTSDGSVDSSTGVEGSTTTGEPACPAPVRLDLPPESLCAAQDEVEAYQPGMVAHAELGLLDVVLVESMPDPPAQGYNAWTLLVREVATCAPVPGLVLDAVPFMPTHGHGSPTVPVITDLGDGTYGVDPLNLFMDGYWRVRITISSEALGDDRAAFHLCIE